MHTTLHLVSDGEHAILTALATQLPEGPAREQLGHVHAEMTAPLRQSLSEASQSDPDLTAELVMAVMFKASELVEGGRPLDEVLPAVDALIDPVD